MKLFSHINNDYTNNDYTNNDREERLNANVKTLYHQTSFDSADKILETNTMLPGKNGLAGGGIYFADNPYDTNRKTLHHGVIY